MVAEHCVAIGATRRTANPRRVDPRTATQYSEIIILIYPGATINWCKALTSRKDSMHLLDFSATDLVAVLKKSPVLLVFDGLDEVADIENALAY